LDWGLRGLARGVAGVAGTCLVAVAAAGVTSVATDGLGTASASDSPWSVTVADANRALYPGTDATMSYDVRNATTATQHLSDVSAALKLDAAGCDARWFRVSPNDVAGVDVPAGTTVHGTLTVAFDAAPAFQAACQNIGITVVVTAS